MHVSTLSTAGVISVLSMVLILDGNSGIGVHVWRVIEIHYALGIC